MNTTSPHARLVEDLRSLSPQKREKLDALQVEGAQLSKRDDLVWHMLLQSMSGMGSNRGNCGLMRNEDNLRNVAWAKVEALPRAQRFDHLHSALAAAKVRWPKKKSYWLTANFDRIERMGGLVAALEKMQAVRGKKDKMKFFQQFDGVGDKYGRNIWMDLCDPDFRDSIAIDVRLRKVCERLRIATDNFPRAEEAMLEIAREAGLTGWQLDRLLFNYTDYFLSVMGRTAAQVKSARNDLDSEEPLVAGGTSATLHVGPSAKQDNEGTCSISVRREQWERIYSPFLMRRNSSGWGKKKEYAIAILREFSGHVPLTAIVDADSRKALSRRLFKSPNDYNHVTYPLCMGVWLGALGLDGDDLVVARHDLMGRLP